MSRQRSEQRSIRPARDFCRAHLERPAEVDSDSVRVKDSGHGALHDRYRRLDELDLQRRTSQTKLELDRATGTVKVDLVPEPANYADDHWGTWNRWSAAGFDATEQQGCPFWSPVRDALRPSVFEASGSGLACRARSAGTADRTTASGVVSGQPRHRPRSSGGSFRQETSSDRGSDLGR